MSIKIPVITENVIIRLSGGADSAILLWMICNEWKKENKPLTVWPITIIHGVRNWQSYHAQQVYDYIQENCYGNFMPQRAWLCENPKEDYVDYQESLIDEVVSEIGETSQVFNGVTANPPEEIGQKYWGSSAVFGEKVWECREKHRDWEGRWTKQLVDDDERRKLIHCCPFIHSHKGTIAELYEKYELMDLLQITRSCEGWDHMTHGFTETCGECWWCMERDWAFNVWNK
tara:strand:- start:4929 stop:5618 length:690 start_codon:yes stop_codon:yes gene_type:complete